MSANCTFQLSLRFPVGTSQPNEMLQAYFEVKSVSFDNRDQQMAPIKLHNGIRVFGSKISRKS